MSLVYFYKLCVYPINEKNGLGVFTDIDQVTPFNTTSHDFYILLVKSACSCISDMSIGQLPRLTYCHILLELGVNGVLCLSFVLKSNGLILFCKNETF